MSFHNVAPDSTSVEVVFDFGHERKNVYFSADRALQLSGDALLCLGLLPAMELGIDLRVDGPVDSKLLLAADSIQNRFVKWRFASNKVQIKTKSPTLSSLLERPRKFGLFFSGGADSFYTLLRSIDERPILITVVGADLPPESPGAAKLATLNHQIAAHLGLEHVVVRTNVRQVLDRHISWEEMHGGVFAAIAHLLSDHIARGILAASADESTADVPWGSSPYLDPLWSSNSVQIDHHGMVHRVEKLAFLSTSSLALNSLRVCYRTQDATNCGRCAKCVFAKRTFELLGVRHQARTFPLIGEVPDVFAISDIEAEAKYEALRDLALREGSLELAGRIEKGLDDFKRRQWLERIFQIRSLRRRWRRTRRRFRAGTLGDRWRKSAGK